MRAVHITQSTKTSRRICISTAGGTVESTGRILHKTSVDQHSLVHNGTGSLPLGAGIHGTWAQVEANSP